MTYGALTMARLGIRTGVLIGVDRPAQGAWELGVLRDAGADVISVALDAGPVFHNQEHPDGRIQTCLSVSDPIPPAAIPASWLAAPCWLLAPVAAELPGAWAGVPPTGACVALGWQGILRHLYPGERVWPLDPGPSALLARADVVGVSRHDLPHGLELDRAASWMRPRSELLLTAGERGGLLLRVEDGRVSGGRRYPGIPTRAEVDPTGAGDTALAGLLCARISGRGDPRMLRRDLHLAALAASLLVEGPGLAGVPSLGAVRRRMADPGSA